MLVDGSSGADVFSDSAPPLLPRAPSVETRHDGRVLMLVDGSSGADVFSDSAPPPLRPPPRRRQGPRQQLAAAAALVLAAVAVVSVVVGGAGAPTDAADGSRSTPLPQTALHPQCLAILTILPGLLDSRSTDDDARRAGAERIELTAHLPTGGCHWDEGTPPRDGTQRVRRCGAASQSGIYPPGEPGLAIDGVYSREMDDMPSCSHTELEPSGSWWQVDLQAAAEVEQVQIWGRTGCCQERLGWASVVVSTTPDFTDGGGVCRGVSGNFGQRDQTETFDCSRAIGQYITVTLASPTRDAPVPGSDYVTICELDAWGAFVTGTHQSSESDHEQQQPGCGVPDKDPYWRQLRRAGGTAEGVDRQLHQRLSQRPGPVCGRSDTNITDGWFRFPGSSDALPTEPVRLSIAGSEQDDSSPTCGALSSAWVSGWDPSLTTAPPLDYSQPGAYPGQGPQYIGDEAQQNEYVLCFEGWWPPPEGDDDQRWQYHSCRDSARATIVHCGSFLIWRLPTPPAVATAAAHGIGGGTQPRPSQAYCTQPSGLFGGTELPLPRWQHSRGDG
jgi:hypothetical protein